MVLSVKHILLCPRPYIRQSIRAIADHVSGSVSLPALATLRAGYTQAVRAVSRGSRLLTLSLRGHAFRSRKALFEEGAFTSAPHGAGSCIVGFAARSGGGNGDRRVPIFFLTRQISRPPSGIGSPFCGLFPLGRGLNASPLFLRGG